jgi:threonine/homoserine/homoserine lactone efflux protein
VGSVFGVRHSLKYLIGIIVGTTLVLVAVATGITASLLALPAIASVLLGISASYTLRLACHIATAAPLSAQTAAVDAPSFASGALLGVAERGGVLRVVPAQKDRDPR